MLTQQQINTIVEWFREDDAMPYTEMAQRLGVGYNQVAQYFWRHGVKRRYINREPK